MINSIEDMVAAARARNAATDAEVERLEERIARTTADLERIRSGRVTPMALAQRLAEEVGRRMPDRQVEVLGPFGLGAEMGIHVNDGTTTVASLTLRPGAGYEGLVVVDPDSQPTFTANTIGAANGSGRRSAPLTGTIDDLVDGFRRQERERAAQETQ